MKKTIAISTARGRSYGLGMVAPFIIDNLYVYFYHKQGKVYYSVTNIGPSHMVPFDEPVELEVKRNGNFNSPHAAYRTAVTITNVTAEPIGLFDTLFTVDYEKTVLEEVGWDRCDAYLRATSNS